LLSSSRGSTARGSAGNPKQIKHSGSWPSSPDSSCSQEGHLNAVIDCIITRGRNGLQARHWKLVLPKATLAESQGFRFRYGENSNELASPRLVLLEL
jgi:hypothetical protein